MVQMFPTIFDQTLEHLFLVEKLPRLSYELSRIRYLKLCQAALRFFRMFLWCIPDCDANLLAGFNFVATSTAQLHKVEEGSGWFSLTHDEYESLARKVEEEMRKCHAEMNKYRQHLISCSLKAEPFTSDETIRFLDSVHVTSNDLLKCYEVETLPITSHVETLQETVFLLRNLVYYTPMGWENYDDISFLSLSDSEANPQANLIFQFNVHDWANKAACFFLLYWLIEREDEENSQEIRRLYTDLQQKVGPCNPEFMKPCFQSIKVPMMKREDRIHFGEFVSRFVDFFLENLILILNDDVPIVREGLIFLITFLADPPTNTVNHSELSSIREQIFAVLDQASDTICFFGDTNMDLARGKTILDDSPSRIPACASCKHQRKKCTQNCVLAPFFPSHKKQEFEAVHQVFGVSNVVKTLKKFQQEEQKRSAIDSITWEALEWEKDPVNGPLGMYKRVLQEHQFYKNEYYKNQRKNLKSVHLVPYGAATATSNGNGNGNGNVAGAEVISPAYTRTTTHTILQNIDSFPSLEKLVVSSCSKLIEIPPCFSEVATLKYIQVIYCKKRVADSAIQIQKGQFDWGNESFEVDLNNIL